MLTVAVDMSEYLPSRTMSFCQKAMRDLDFPEVIKEGDIYEVDGTRVHHNAYLQLRDYLRNSPEFASLTETARPTGAYNWEPSNIVLQAWESNNPSPDDPFGPKLKKSTQQNSRTLGKRKLAQDLRTAEGEEDAGELSEDGTGFEFRDEEAHESDFDENLDIE